MKNISYIIKGGQKEKQLTATQNGELQWEIKKVWNLLCELNVQLAAAIINVASLHGAKALNLFSSVTIHGLSLN